MHRIVADASRIEACGPRSPYAVASVHILMEAALEVFLDEFFNVLVGPKPLRPPGSVTQRLVTNEMISESL